MPRAPAMDSRIRKNFLQNQDTLIVFLNYVKREFLRKELILTYVVLFVCTVGMLYQSIDILSDYLDHPTIVNILEEREAAKFPAITMCLSPWYNLTMICEKLDGKCTKKDLMITLSYPKHGFYREWRDVGLSDPSVLFSCNMTSTMPGCPAFECQKILRHIYYKVPMMACYTLDLERFLPKNHLFFHCANTWSYELMIEARWNPRTTMNSMDMVYYPIYVHESTVYSPEPMYSAAMRKDVFVYYTITQQVWSRLKKPYHTDCWDYRELFGWKEQPVFQGWMNQLSCEQKCRMAQEHLRCNCIRTVNEFSHFAEPDLCDIVADDKCSAIMTANNSFFYQKCDMICNSECRTTRYDVRLSGMENYHPKNHKKNRNDDIVCGFSIAFSSATVEIYNLIPAMNSEMLLGIIAGFIGVWVGLSFIDLADYVILLIPEREPRRLREPMATLPPNYRGALYNYR